MLTADLLYLFRGNPNVVGLDRSRVDQDGEEVPGPLRLEPDMARQQWLTLMEGHLAGSGGIGVYPYNHEQEGVAWGCVDFDEGDLPSWSYALDLRLGLHELGITGFIERSRSKGYHVWVFFGGWVPPGLVRRALVGVCQAVNAPAKEVNPKSVTLQAGQLGNFVRLPYKGVGDRLTVAPPSCSRQVVVDDLGRPLSPALFLTLALDTALSVHELARAAKSIHVEPEPKERPLRNRYSGPWKEQLAPLAQAELANGPLPGQDRSGYLSGFAHACRESGLRPEDAEKAVRLADLLHGRKYTDRNDADKRYGELIARAYDTQEGA